MTRHALARTTRTASAPSVSKDTRPAGLAEPRSLLPRGAGAKTPPVSPLVKETEGLASRATNHLVKETDSLATGVPLLGTVRGATLIEDEPRAVRVGTTRRLKRAKADAGSSAAEAAAAATIRQ